MQHSRTLLNLGAALLLTLTSCHSRLPEQPLDPSDASTRYASLLQMQDLDGGMTLCRILNPWQPERVAAQYLLHPSDSLADSDIADIEAQFGPVLPLHVPLQHQALTAACQASLYTQLDALDCIGALCDADYVLDPQVLARLDDGSILEAGGSMAPNTEVLLAARCECIWITPYEAGSQSMISAVLPELPIIYCADYMETAPLARAEWMRFYGRLADRGQRADSLFDVVERSYLSQQRPVADTLTSDSATDVHRPLLLAELPYGATWYVPGGRSSASWIYQDAGFGYPWSDDVHGGSLALSAESVYAQAHDAEVWIFKYYDPDTLWTMPVLLGQHPLYSEFAATQTGRVYGCNTARTDYFEVAPFRPDVILNEMRHILRAENDSLLFFHQLK